MDFNRPLNELALQYNLANPTVASVIVGASTVEQLKKNVQAVKGEKLSKNELKQLQSYTKKNVYQEHR